MILLYAADSFTPTCRYTKRPITLPPTVPFGPVALVYFPHELLVAFVQCTQERSRLELSCDSTSDLLISNNLEANPNKVGTAD